MSVSVSVCLCVCILCHVDGSVSVYRWARGKLGNYFGVVEFWFLFVRVARGCVWGYAVWRESVLTPQRAPIIFLFVASGEIGGIMAKYFRIPTVEETHVRRRS